MLYTLARPYERCQVDRLQGQGACTLLVHREKVAYYKETTGVSKKGQKWNRRRVGKFGGPGPRGTKLRRVPVKFRRVCGLPPLHGDIGYVQVQDKTGVIRIVLICMPTYPKPYLYHNSGMFLHRLLCTPLPVWG